ncbi:nucleoporin Nup188 [Achroia grisella]|uniref:nucleoporin Nup188 n=1 Tax=Achroia grisella TaxID=688607 RepID=UPI0027D34764|nr:nucleoporin Nup188 [Achroia grisella]
MDNQQKITTNTNDQFTSSYWKQLWRWTTSGSLKNDELLAVLGTKEITDALCQGLASYKPNKPELYAQLQRKYPDQTKLLSVIHTLQNYMDIDCFKLWDIVQSYLCDISYGTASDAMKNIAFVDTRPTFLLPNIWNFYYSERLFLLKLLQYIIEVKDNTNHVYQKEFMKIYTDIKGNIVESLISQFDKLISTAPPSRKIQSDFSSETVRQEWAESNQREQLTILQILLILASETSINDEKFNKLLCLFKKHNFGKNQGYNELLGETHREFYMRIMYIEVCLFMVILDSRLIKNPSSWIETTKQNVECELTKLQMNVEHSAMLITWMLLTLQSEQHSRLFESHYQHFGTVALRMHVFEFLLEMLNNSVFSDNSKCSKIARQRVFCLLNDLCNKFDGDGTLSHQPGIIQLCADLLKTPDIANQFWKLHQKDDDNGVVSLWNTALEYFPYNFNALSILAAGLAEAGKSSVINLIAELKNLPVYTEIYNPNAVPVMSLQLDDAIIGREYYPLGDLSYRIEAGSKATIMERKEGTMIHFRTPCSYWTVFNNEIGKALDRKQHHQHNISLTLERVYEGTKILKGILKALVEDQEIPKSLVVPSEGVFDILVRFMRADNATLPLLVECLQVCTALIPVFPKEIHMRLINTGLLPRVLNQKLSHVEYASGASFDTAAVGSFLITIEQPTGSYKFLGAYIDLLCAFHKVSNDERITTEIILPGLILTLREVFPNVCGWRYKDTDERRHLLKRCANFLGLVLQHSKETNNSIDLLKRTGVYSLLYTENALELLKIISVGNDQLERMMQDETNWTSGTGSHYLSTLQRCVAIVMFTLRLKSLVVPTDSQNMTPLEHLIFAQNKQKDSLKVVPKVTSYINHAFNKNLPVLCCRLLKKFAGSFQMSLFSSLDMTAYQVRVMFLNRLRDEYETMDLKVSILEFIATCVGKQPGLTEAFFMMNYEKAKADEKNKDEIKSKTKSEPDDSFEGILGYMADYLSTVKSDAKLLHSPLLASIMELFHELWKNNMQILVKKLRENPNFWEHITSPLFNEIQPNLRTYAQIFNVLGIEIFTSRDKLEPNLKETLELFFDTNKKHLDTWIDYIFSFKGRTDTDEVVDKVPVWLGLLTSWKDFTTIFSKCLRDVITLNIAHKAKMVAPCMNALLTELEDMKDSRLVVILAELYVIMLANWKDDCFDNRKTSAKQIDSLLTNSAIMYECLHPRAVRAILSIGTVAISSLDYEIKASSITAQSIIRSVTNINTIELENLFDDINEPKPDPNVNGSQANGNIPPVVLSLAMLEQCLDLYDDMFSGLSQWFQSSRFVNKLLCCLQKCLQNRRHYHTSLSALRCLTAYSRGPFSKDLLMSDVDQFLWLQLLPPKFDNNGGPLAWKPHEWWRVYAYSLDFISMMVMKHGQFFVSDAITFVGVHLEHLIEAILLPRQVFSIEALNLCASVLNLIVQLVKYESRWRIQNINSLVGIMRSISACFYQCVTLMLRSRRSSDPTLQTNEESFGQAPSLLHRTLEVLHMSTLCLLAFSPDLLSLLADPGLDLEHWQPLVELHFGAPKITYEPFPQLTFGTLLSAICLLTRSLYHSYQCEEGSGWRSPRGRRRTSGGGGGSGGSGGVGGSPEARRGGRSESLTSVSSATSVHALPGLDERLVGAALAAAAALLASQALLAVRDPNVPSRHKQLVRRELGSELAPFHDFVRKRILFAAHGCPYLVRNKLDAWPLRPDEEEIKRIEDVRKERNISRDDDDRPPPPPPKRVSSDSMREYILRKHYLDKCAQTPIKGPHSPVSHSTPTSDKKKETSRSSKRVSWAETTRENDESLDSSLQDIEPVYSNLTDVQINNDEDYFHLMSVVFLYICQSEL